MDINAYLRILRVEHTDNSLSEYVNGVVCNKNVAHKRMPKEIMNPKIMILQGETDSFFAERKIVSMDNLIDQENDLTKIFIRKIEKISPNVIVVEKSLPQPIITELSKMGIATLINVKMKILQMLSRVAKGQILTSVDQISHLNKYFAECTEFYQKSLGNSTYAFFKGLSDNSLGATIIISGSDNIQLKKIARIIRKLALEYRNVRLEKRIISQSRLESYPGIFLDYSSESITYKYLAVCAHRLCEKPKTIKIDFYKANDRPLGEFLVTMIKTADEKCECGRLLGVHTFYYIKSAGRIKVRLSKSTIGIKDIIICKECKACGKTEERSEILSKAAWEYSFNKFLEKFFVKKDTFHEGRKCRHDFYKFARYQFHAYGIKITIQWEENPIFDLVTTGYKDLTRYYNNLLSKTYSEMMGAIKDVLEDMLSGCKDIIIRISNEFSEEVLREQQLK